MWRGLTIISKTVNSKNKPIGFFDSGVGGLTVFSEFRKLMPNEDCVYFGDTKNMPYGEKSKEQLINFSKRAFEFFEKKNVKAVVMACNTTSATVYDVLKNDYPFKLYPIIQSVSKILAQLPASKIGVFATPATIKSKAYSININKFDKSKEIIEIACPEWVKLVEEGKENSPESFRSIKEKLDEMMRYNPEKIVLGCTHYPYLLKQLSQVAGKDIFINPAKYFVEYIKSDLESLDMISTASEKGSEAFYTSASPENFRVAAGLFYAIKDLPQKL